MVSPLLTFRSSAANSPNAVTLHAQQARSASQAMRVSGVAAINVRTDSLSLLSMVSLEYLFGVILLAEVSAELCYDFSDPAWWRIRYQGGLLISLLAGFVLDIGFLLPPVYHWLDDVDHKRPAALSPTAV